MKVFELHNQPVEADTYEASMALNQLLKIGRHAIKIHNMIDDSAEMEAWVAKKIDLAGDYVKKVHGYMQGEKAGLYDDGGLTEDAPFGSGMDLLRMAIMKKFISVQEWDLLKHKWKDAAAEVEEKYSDWPEGEGFGSSDHNFAIRDLMTSVGYEFDDKDTSGRFVVTKQPEEIEKAGIKNARMRDAVTTEDAGEGHMSKSTLYHTAKYAIELMDMINKGDDLEGWVQSKLNKAADYLQGVHNYEEYQKLNPYREELDANILQKHAGIVQKHIDEILAKETTIDDVDTKPGMMRILAKRVNEVEKEIAKEQRKEQVSERMPASIIKHKEKLAYMSDKELAQHFKDKDDETLKQMAWRHGYGKMSPHYVNRRNRGMNEDSSEHREVKAILDKHGITKADDIQLDTPVYDELFGYYMDSGEMPYGIMKARTGMPDEWIWNRVQELGLVTELEEGLKDWAKRLAAAGVIVGAVAGMGSINNAIDNSVPAVKAMNTAYEMAVDQGHTELADQIKKDISAVKVRLDSGRDLNFVKAMQDKYSKFMQTEGLAYESKLAIMLNQRIK